MYAREKQFLCERRGLMFSKILLAALLALSIGVVSCHKLAIPDIEKEGSLQFVTPEISDGIAATLGRFVAVTPHPENAHWAALWFEQENGTISVVWVNVVARNIQEQVLTIPRK
jgi:hypothetical protein